MKKKITKTKRKSAAKPEWRGYAVLAVWKSGFIGYIAGFSEPHKAAAVALAKKRQAERCTPNVNYVVRPPRNSPGQEGGPLT